MRLFFITGYAIILLTNLNAQDFVNGDLAGPPIVSSSILPHNWQVVEYYDQNCEAIIGSQATADLTDNLGPAAFMGIAGNPYSGNTFVSGLYGGNPGVVWHEGIQQTVSGFCIGCRYTINFYQAVVKQHNFRDSSGSWKVVVDNTVAGISLPTLSQLPVGIISLEWQYRSIMFQATSTTHTIKFLPADDDTILNFPNPYSGLRMGIDLISLTQVFLLPIELIDFSATVNKKNVILNWSTASETNNAYFTIERSGSEMKWEEIARITGSGTTTQIKEYYLIDNPLKNGIYYYRLKQIDYDNNFTYSKTVSVYIEKNDLMIYPNPSSDKLFVKINEPGEHLISLYNINSKKVFMQSVVAISMNELDISELPKGYYILTIENDESLIHRENVIIN